MACAVLSPDQDGVWRVQAAEHDLEADTGFWAIYDHAFIAEEREPRSVIKSLAASRDALVYVFRTGGRTVGLCTVELLESLSCGFIVYLAVDPSLRGSGLGSAMISSVLSGESYRSAGIGFPKRFILEVEHPAEAEDEQDRMLRERRIGFFAKSSLAPLFDGYLQPPLYTGAPILPMVLLATKGWAITPQQAAAAIYREKYLRVNGIDSHILADLYYRSFGSRQDF